MCLSSTRFLKTFHSTLNIFPNGNRLYRAEATFLLYLEKLKTLSAKTPCPQEVSFEMIAKAKRVVIRQAQRNELLEEICTLKVLSRLRSFDLGEEFNFSLKKM